MRFSARVGVVAIALAVFVAACAGEDEPTVDSGPATTQTTEAATSAPETTTTTHSAGELPAAVTEPPAVPAEPGFEPPPSNPANLVVAGDESQVVTAIIDGAGGTISAESADGVVFTLQIPEGALLSPVEISLTPATSVAGDPLDAATEATAVTIEPHGLVLLTPATLEIVGPGVEGDAIAFGAYESGEDFHLLPSLGVDGVAMSVSHFSVFGAVTGAVEEIRANYSPSAQNAQAMDEIAAINRQVRDPQAAYEARLEVLIWWGDVILTRLGSASMTDERLEAAVAEFLEHHSATVEYWLTADERYSAPELEARLGSLALGEALFAALDTAIRRHSSACVQNRDPVATFRILRWYLVGTALSFGDPSDETIQQLDEWRKLVKQCLAFDVVFETEVSIGTSDVAATTKTRAVMPVRTNDADLEDLAEGTGSLSGVKADLNVSSVDVGGDNRCNYVGGPGEVEGFLRADLNLYNNRDVSTTTIEGLHIDLLIREPVSIQCVAGGYTGVEVGDAFWYFPFTQANKDRIDSAGLMGFDVPIVEDGDTYAKLVIKDTISIPKGEMEVTTRFKVLHKPRTF